MSTITISQLPNSGALTGTEVLPIVQSNTTVQTTVQAVANLAGGIIAVGAGTGSTVRVGNSNTASGACSTVSGGANNAASGCYSTIGGGRLNTASGSNSTVGGGGGYYGHTASGNCSTIGGGDSNTASSIYSTVGGGKSNTASGACSIIGGGSNNTAGATYSAILGGNLNTISSGCNGAMIVGSGITADRCNTTFVNNLSIKNIPTSALGLPSGAVFSCVGVLRIVT